MSNFIPNKLIKVTPRDPPWIDKNLKTMLNRQQRLYKNCKKHGFKNEYIIPVETFRQECNIAIKKSNEEYFSNIGNKLANPDTCQKLYWKLINRVMNRCKALKIPPILVNNVFVVNPRDNKHPNSLNSFQINASCL